MANNLLFDKDIFLKTNFPVAVDSPDHIDPWGGTQTDFTDGSRFAKHLLELFPEKRTLIDLGTATGTIPLTMRTTPILAVGLEGSDVSKTKGLAAWSEMPGIVRTCDISRPFQILDANHLPYKFDYVVSWGVFEHIHSDRLDILWQNIQGLMGPESIGVFNIDSGENKYHQSGGLDRNGWQEKISANFEIINDLTFDADGQFKYHPYCRPRANEIEYILKYRLTFDSGRTFWWVKLKNKRPE
jgi:hypothetical protein